MQGDHYSIQANYIFGYVNKITIMEYKKDVGITYNVHCTHEQKEFKIVLLVITNVI